jgi:hypothetical protein
MYAEYAERINSDYYDYDDRYYHNEFECSDCAKHKKELDSNEEAFNNIRYHLELLVDNLSSKSLDLNINEVNLSLANMCVELGVDFNLANIKRNSCTGVYLRS